MPLAEVAKHSRNIVNLVVIPKWMWPINISVTLKDDARPQGIAAAYKAGTLTTGELKKECISQLQEYVNGYQTRRKEVTDDVLELYMKPRKLEWGRRHALTRAKELAAFRQVCSLHTGPPRTPFSRDLATPTASS